MHLFEVNIKNRVIKKSFAIKPQRIKGRQGGWYTEILYYLANSEEEARKFAKEQIEKRIIIGVSRRRYEKLMREIKILEVRRLA